MGQEMVTRTVSVAVKPVRRQIGTTSVKQLRGARTAHLQATYMALLVGTLTGDAGAKHVRLLMLSIMLEAITLGSCVVLRVRSLTTLGTEPCPPTMHGGAGVTPVERYIVWPTKTTVNSVWSQVN